MRELIERYSPSVLWNDISWPTSLRPMLRLMADYYAAVPGGRRQRSLDASKLGAAAARAAAGFSGSSTC